MIINHLYYFFIIFSLVLTPAKRVINIANMVTIIIGIL